MARRKSVVVIVLLILLVLLVSPWASAPAPEQVPAVKPEGTNTLPVVPVMAEEPADLRAAIILNLDAYKVLEEQNARFEARHPDIHVELRRIDPHEASALLDNRLENGQLADIALIPAEWVKPLAVSGVLLPADAAFVGEALSEQFDVLASAMKWNGYLWGVPHHLDPYELIWNRNLLASLHREDGTPLHLPLSAEDWLRLPEWLAIGAPGASWLALAADDPQAVLTWLGAAAGQRPDLLLGDEGLQWNGQSFENDLSLVTEHGNGIQTFTGNARFWSQLASGSALVTVVRRSEAEAGLASLPASASGLLEVDRSNWERSFAWPNGESFVLSANTLHEDTARTWMAEMTEASMQQQNDKESGLLPVYRTVYATDGKVSPNFAAAQLSVFPNVASLAPGPEAAYRLNRFQQLWTQLLEVRISLEDFKREWVASFAEYKANN